MTLMDRKLNFTRQSEVEIVVRPLLVFARII